MTTVSESSDEWRIVSLNIRQGGGSRIEQLASRLLGYDAEILVITEFRCNKAGGDLKERLRCAGYAISHPDTAAHLNTVLIAARQPVHRSRPFLDDLDTHHHWCIDIGPLTVCGVYMPLDEEKWMCWASLIEHEHSSGVDLLIGDFNVGHNDLDKDPQRLGSKAELGWVGVKSPATGRGLNRQPGLVGPVEEPLAQGTVDVPGR